VCVTCLCLAFVLFCLDHHPLHTACKHVYILSIRKASDMACKYNMHLADATAHVLSPTQTGHCGVQNPVNSVVWLVANYSLLAPLTTLPRIFSNLQFHYQNASTASGSHVHGSCLPGLSLWSSTPCQHLSSVSVPSVC